MFTDYSKPAADVAPENLDLAAQGPETLLRQERLTRLLAAAPPRDACLLCRGSLAAAVRFRQRSLDYLVCGRCGHLQTAAHPPAGYPREADAGLRFDRIYPDLAPEDRRDRCERVYLPKLEWVLRRLEAEGKSRGELLQRRWLDLGAGAGYFLEALQRAGARFCTGLEANENLVRRANRALGGETVRTCSTDLADALGELPADVITAFFVLEHLPDAHGFWSTMAARPRGTVFAFAVPVFGFATLLEGATEGWAARNLDGAVHTQLYTDRSIRFALEASGYEMTAEWIFGQDALDLRRFLVGKLQERYPEELLVEISAGLAGLLDPFQGVLDRARLADARHVLAVKC